MIYQFRQKGFSLYECPSCGYQSFFPRPKSTTQFYQQSSYFHDGQKFLQERNKKIDITLLPQYQTFVKRLDQIIRSKNFKKGARLLDVGCGSGLFVYLCRKSQIEARGIDISKPGIELSRSVGGNCYLGDFIREHRSTKVDYITMFDVIEHVPNPREFFLKVNTSLKKGGYFIFTTPCADSFARRIFGKYWHLYTPPRHLQIFTTKSIRLLLKEFRLEVISQEKEGQYTNLGYIIAKLLKLYNINNKVLNIVLKSKLFQNINIYLNLFDVVTTWTKKV